MSSILFINRVYPPSDGATGRVLEYVARGFVQAGWNVSVLTTGMPLTCSLKPSSEIRDGVIIYRSHGNVHSKGNIFSRAITSAAMMPSFFLSALQIPRNDVVVTMTDPPMLLIVGVLIGICKNSRLIHWAQDLYPEIAEELGVISRGGWLARLLRVLSTLSMRLHHINIVPGHCMKERLLDRGLSNSKVRVILNSGVEQSILPLSRFPNSFRELHGLGESFIIEYSGNMGRAHDFDTVLAAASIVQSMDMKNILFLFIGNGAQEQAIREEVVTRSLKNVHFLPFQPEEMLNQSFAAADLHLVTMKEGMLGLVVPSKIYGVMAAARACLFVGPSYSEIAREIHLSGAGDVINPGDANQLARVILKYVNSPLKIKKCGAMGNAWVRAQNSLGLFIECASDLLR